MTTLNKNHISWYNENYYNKNNPRFNSWSLKLLKLISSKDLGNKKILDLGCGEAKILASLHKNKKIKASNLYGIDQSNKAIEIASASIPNGNLVAGDIYNLKYKNEFLDYIFLLETIEHLENPEQVLKEIHKVIKKAGKLYISFPNYFNFPWLLVRIFAQLFNKPNWIVLQPIDKIYNFYQVIKMVEKIGFRKVASFGTCYFPPILYKFENLKISSIFDKLGLSLLAFHPIIVFEKK
jgi:2-polyprenyl-3-methyl-5-hydroxy-6-metoxy-1,4-benzoquinol methylase